MMNTIKCVRGCGTRKSSGLYLCTGQSITGSDIEKFIIDPAIVWSYEWIRGFKIVDSSRGYNNVLIFVGKQFYKAPWDFVEECRRFGASRHVRSDFPFSQLTPGKSRMVFIHKNVIPRFNYEIISDYCEDNCKCMKFKGHHIDLPNRDNEPCAYALRDLAILNHLDTEVKQNGEFEIKMPEFNYTGKYPDGINIDDKIQFRTGAFLSLIITHIECPILEDDDITPKVVKAQNKVNQAGYDFQMLDY